MRAEERPPAERTETPVGDRPERPARPSGRRARKRAETHVALVEAALACFAERGYEATTVEEIADRAGVSARTAFRYFPSKEDLLFVDYEAEMGRWAGALEQVPAGETLLEGLRTATQAVVADYFRRPEFWDRVRALTADEPALSARAQRSEALLQNQAAEVIARRIGLDAAADPRPRVLAAAAMAAVGIATQRWYASGKTIDYAGEVDAAFDRLGELDALLATRLTADGTRGPGSGEGRGPLPPV